LSLKCASRRNQPDNLNLRVYVLVLHSRAERTQIAIERDRFVGWVERSDVNQLLPGTVMGFAALYPSYEVCDFCLRASSRARAAQSSTVAALRQSRPFRHGPVVLRFANRPCPPLPSAQFAFPGVAGVRPAQKSTATEGLRICRSIRVRERPKKRRAPMLA
jgi:hypothetical protein